MLEPCEDRNNSNNIVLNAKPERSCWSGFSLYFNEYFNACLDWIIDKIRDSEYA